MNETNISSADGSWSFIDPLMLIDDNYTVEITFADALKQVRRQMMNIHINSAN